MWKANKKRRIRFLKSWPVILGVVIVLVGGIGVGLHSWYTHNLGAVSSSSHQTIYYTVESGSTVNQIAQGLKQAGLIRNAQAFETYVRGKELFNELQAGTYALSPSMSTPQIVNKMTSGDVAKNLVTILPGKRLDQVKQAFAQAGYSGDEIAVAFNPSSYSGHPALDSLPAGATLEGFLYPDSFQKEAETPAQTIVGESLDEMAKQLSPDIVAGFSAHGLNVYQGVTLASIVYQETGNPSDEPIVAQVFLSRLAQNMALGSDVTAFYASDIAGVPRSLTIDSAYNTRINPGLPPGPIGNFTADALKAVARPANTNYLYFVAGDDGVMHYSHTQAEQDQAVSQYCTKSCSQ